RRNVRWVEGGEGRQGEICYWIVATNMEKGRHQRLGENKSPRLNAAPWLGEGLGPDAKQQPNEPRPDAPAFLTA
ncbi:MAG TPA: hypothetical protein VMI31_16090, partial [Fimbriimonadaceae bacterium]|nr:hypothetical protein [Fimbriimonadaceae bacterium]